MRRFVIPGTVVLVLVVAVVTFTLTPLSKLISDPADGQPALGVTEVVIRGSEFNPPSIEIKAGTTVTWRFVDMDEGQPVAHNLVGEGWRSPDLQTGVYRHTFDRPGTYKYTCDLHLLMNGGVTVVD